MGLGVCSTENRIKPQQMRITALPSLQLHCVSTAHTLAVHSQKYIYDPSYKYTILPNSMSSTPPNPISAHPIPLYYPVSPHGVLCRSGSHRTKELWRAWD